MSPAAHPLSKASGGTPGAALAGGGPSTPSHVSRLVAFFLRVLLVPLVLVGLPLWPLLALSCAVPVVALFTIPLFLLLTVLLLYSVAWLSYLVLAQSDVPPPAGALLHASASSGSISGGGGGSGAQSGESKTAAAGTTQTTAYHHLPFLPYSPLRCLKVNWAAAQYGVALLRLALPAVFDWSYRRVMLLGTQQQQSASSKAGRSTSGNGNAGIIVKENILYGSPFPNKRLDVYLPPAKPTLGGSAGAGARAAATAATNSSGCGSCSARGPHAEALDASVQGAALAPHAERCRTAARRRCCCCARLAGRSE